MRMCAEQANDKRPATILYATHDPRLIAVADNVMCIGRGQVSIVPRAEYMRRVSELQRQRDGKAVPSPSSEPADPAEQRA